MKSPKIWLLIIFLTAASSALAGFQSESWEVLPGLPEYEVYWAIDGNTIEVEGLGEVKYIGVVTPKLRKGLADPEPFALEAWEANGVWWREKRSNWSWGMTKETARANTLPMSISGPPSSTLIC